MGLFEGLMKVIQGKPVFDAEEPQRRSEEATSPMVEASPPTVSTAGEKIIPELQLEHCKTHVNGSEIVVTVWVTNKSAVDIELDKITMLGTTTELDRLMAPDEAREVKIYEGAAPVTDSDGMAQLQYKQKDNGDYFRADFRIEFDYDSQGFYKIEEFHPLQPVRDI